MAKQGFGAIFQLSATTITGSTGKLSEVTSVGIPNPTQGTSETTHHESAGGVREYLPDLVDIAEFTVKLNVTPGSTTDLAAAAAAVSRALYFFKSTVPGHVDDLHLYRPGHRHQLRNRRRRHQRHHEGDAEGEADRRGHEGLMPAPTRDRSRRSAGAGPSPSDSTPSAPWRRNTTSRLRWCSSAISRR
jgi:hypothetical protein